MHLEVQKGTEFNVNKTFCESDNSVNNILNPCLVYEVGIVF